ncbi:helix-turn-helix domain-containing protein [Streptosporangium sp. NBC_01469]|uniref:helix-turn-helix domain-containing protein n=1 Tax=Streptosporangium sp. NBC_01469 TaxID=2903898 RepID=UPI002E2C8A6F|nr:helix-turn-helix domain-containing protein [Streptosporangium sp. NBC_01469]
MNEARPQRHLITPRADPAAGGRYIHGDVGLEMDIGPGLASGDRETQFGALRVATRSFQPLRLWRASENPVVPEDRETYQLLVPLAGTMNAVWDDRQATSSVGSLVVHDMSRLMTCEFRTRDRGTDFRTALVTVPRSLLPLPCRHIDRILGNRIAACEGVGALLAGFVTNLAGTPEAYRPSDGPRLGMVLLDLISALFARTIDDSFKVPSHREALTLRIKAFIQQHLNEPGLTPRALAVEHHISTSYLHRLFQEQDTTVSSYVRAERLNRARRDLADPALRDVSIHSIAAKWGFSQAADFSRAFRNAFGFPPREFRREALRTAPEIGG